MKTILVTGSAGFMGRNLCLALTREGQFEVLGFDVHVPAEDLETLSARADLVFHLAGVNRPKDPNEFIAGNADLTDRLCNALTRSGHRTPLVLSSSIQAALDNPYGQSKKLAEESVLRYHQQTGAPVYIFRFPNVYGKWSRPNYNTVVATFCHNISRDLPVRLNDRASLIHFVYIDDIVRDFLALARKPQHAPELSRPEPRPVHTITLEQLHDLLVSFREGRRKNLIPDLADPFTRHLYSTYVSFYEPDAFPCPVELRTDARGWLFELIKSPHFGQIFVSRTRPGVARGNHYHDSKIEKFCVISGEGVIRLRSLFGSQLIEYMVNDRSLQVVDIPPGYTHSIENTGSADMITLFWANEIFDPQQPDTYPAKVRDEKGHR